MKLLSRVTDAYEGFLEACGLFLLSLATGRKWIFRSLPDTSVFGEKDGKTGRFLNLWFVLLGPSRLGRKSTVIRHVKELSEKVFGIQCILTESFTPESLIAQMSKMSLHSVTGRLETVCCWISDEIAWFFQHLKKRDSYMASADSFLSKIYDGSTYSRGTIGRGKETVWNPYLVCLLASTDYLPTLFDELQIRLGFMNRFIFISSERLERKSLRTEPLTEEEKKEAREIEDYLDTLAKRISVTTLEMSNEAKAVYDSFEEEIETRIASEKLGVLEGYCGNLPNLLVRLSCLYRISRMTTEEIESYSKPVLIVEKQDVERAISYAWKAWTWFEKVVQIMRKPSTRESTRGNLTTKGREMVIQLLKEGPKKREHLLPHTRKAGIKDTLLDNVILPSLLKDNTIKRDKFAWYSLVTDSANRSQENGE